MSRQLFDRNLRVRKSVLNIAVFYMLLVGFLYSLIVSRYVQNTVLYICLSMLQPIVVFGIPSLFTLLSEKKFSASLPAVNSVPWAIRKRDFLYALLVAVSGWLFYSYFSYMAEGLRAAITSSLSVRLPVSMRWWEYLLAVASAGIIAALLREYFFRYLGRKAYGRTLWGYLLAALLSAFVCYDIAVACRLFVLGILAAAVYYGTGRMIFPFLVAVVFESMQVVLPYTVVFPLSVYTATSVETALVFGLFSGAVALVFAGVAYWGSKLIRTQIVKRKFIMKKQEIFTYVLCVITFVGLLIWNKFI